MKVLHLATGNLFGGIETCLIEFARARGLCPEMTQEFSVCFDGRLEEELRATGASVHRLVAMRASRPWTVWRGRRSFDRLLEERQFDAVIVHSCWCYALLAGVAKRRGISLLLWGHGEFSGRSWEEQLSKRIPPAVIIANSHFTAQSIGCVFPKTPFEVIRYPLSAPNRVHSDAERADLRGKLGIPEGAVAILQASRMEAWKGHANLLEALAQIQCREPWVALFAGGAQRESERLYFDGLQSHAKALGLSDRVRFLGQRRDVPDLMNAADIFCQPNSGPEPFGLVFVEALYACRPVVSFAFGGAAEIVTERCGILAPPGDIGALSGALGRLIDDRELRETLGAAGPGRARELCAPERSLRLLVEVTRRFKLGNRSSF